MIQGIQRKLQTEIDDFTDVASEPTFEHNPATAFGGVPTDSFVSGAGHYDFSSASLKLG